MFILSLFTTTRRLHECPQTYNPYPKLVQLYFLLLVMKLLLLQPFPIALQEPGAMALFSLICCNPARFRAAASQLIERQTEPATAARLTEAFTALMQSGGLALALDRRNMAQFAANFGELLVVVRGALLVS